MVHPPVAEVSFYKTYLANTAVMSLYLQDQLYLILRPHYYPYIHYM